MPVLLSFAQNVHFQTKKHSFVVKQHSKSLIFDGISKDIQKALLALATKWCTEEEILKIAGNSSRPTEIYYCISKLKSAGFLCQGVAHHKKLLATFQKSSAGECGTLDRTKQHILSCFIYLQFTGNGLTMRSPLSRCSVILHETSVIEALMKMTQPFRIPQLRRKLMKMEASTFDTFINLLWSEQFLEVAHPQNSTMMLWEFHDLLFHTQSREGRNLKPIGGTFRFAGKIDPLPAIKPNIKGETISLEKPPASDDSLTRILEERKSIRAFDDSRPITIQQLGYFLYRVARIKSVIKADPSNLETYEVAIRPYPGGGACYELEIYLTVRVCEGLEPGFYYYNAKEHILSKISAPSSDTDQLLASALKANFHSTPQVLITIAARFGRVSWKYESMAYATILKNVGVLLQTMYLVATQMELGPCALGGGDSDLFARIAGTNYYEETSIGEFMLGSKK